MEIYGALLVTGLVGSLGHCLGMCGPLVWMVGLQIEAKGMVVLLRYLVYHGARVTVYALLGAFVAGISSLLAPGARLGMWPGVLSMVLGLGVALLGLGYLGWLPMLQTPRLGRLWHQAQSWALPKARHPAGLALIGALNGLLPCALVYSALLTVAASRRVTSGALGMLAFGVGTAPALLVVGWSARALGARVRKRLARVAGFLIGLIGLQLILRGLAALSIVPHLRVGKVMLW
jgi:sulfite exporter TauE/SafE